MKSVFLALAAFSLNAFAAPATVTTCLGDLSKVAEESPASMKIEILNDAGRTFAWVTNVLGDKEDAFEDSVTEFENPIREGLSAKSVELTDLNQAEEFIVHAMMWMEDPAMSVVANLQFDLKAVRSAKVYQVGPMTDMGTVAIVEAKDASGAVIGRYIGGFFVAACQ